MFEGEREVKDERNIHQFLKGLNFVFIYKKPGQISIDWQNKFLSNLK